ncbi:MAG TPA: proline dehydrogenase family protein [Edaphobacter sp.]|nr:proline dehydrogenase family protein [Edaphobacter sp.]
MLRSVLIALSQNKRLRNFSERSSIGRKLSSRFIAGMTIEDALAVCERVNQECIAVTLDFLGESVRSEPEARAAADVYHRLLDAISDHKLNANISVKLSQMGMEFDPELAERIMGELVEHASAMHSFVRIDMESSFYTEATIAMTERLAARFPGCVGTVLQAYLYRTPEDATRLLNQGIRIRLCKGAYNESPAIAFASKAEVDASYIRLMKQLVTFSREGKGVFCGIATHDESIIEKLLAFVREKKIPKDAFEFQMLYGIRRDLQRQLATDGFGVRVYVPFGPEWFPYFMRRLAERPANLLFLVKNFLRS